MAPPLRFDEVMQGEAQVPRLGHPALIEFWATWCAPCTASIPHLNELQREFSGEGVDFLWVSNEDAATVRPFLAKHPMLGTVALDKNGVAYGAFDGRGLPITVLIDATGRVAAITRSMLVDASVLKTLADGRPLPMAPNDKDMHLTDEHSLFRDLPAKDQMATVRMVIERSNKPGGMMSTEHEWRSDGFPLKDLLAAAYSVYISQIDMPDYLNKLYSVEAWTPERSRDSIHPVMQAALAAAASIQVKREQRTMDVLVMMVDPGRLKPAHDTGEDQIAGGDTHVANYSSVSAETIRSTVQFDLQADRPVVLEKPVAGRFAFTLRNDPYDHSVLMRSLEEQGITLKPGKRVLDVLLVEPTFTVRMH